MKLSFGLLLFSLFPTFVGLFLVRKNWRRNAYMAVPNATNITSSVEFTPILALAFEPFWRAFRFRHSVYTDLFRDANAAQLWNPKGEEARDARAQRRASDAKTNRLIIAAVAIAIIFGVWNEYGDYVLDLLDRLR